MTMLRDIAQLGDQVLRQKAEAVDDVCAVEIQQIIEDMLGTLASTQGVGLAAPQIGDIQTDHCCRFTAYAALSLGAADGADGYD